MAKAASPFSRPLYVMAKPIGAHCNLSCRYCYYLEKQHLYADVPQHLMTEETLEHFIQTYIEAQTADEVLFTWHGGEPLLRPLSFYKKAVTLQQKYANGRRIANALQTNGTLLTEDWTRFLAENHWLVGVSIDGTQEMHDAFRINRQGRPSWVKVRRGIDLLNRFGVEWNAMAVVNNFNADYPLDFYRFFRDELECRYLQFTPIVERGLDCNVAPRQWGEFLCQVFDEWVGRDVGEMFVQLFDATLANWVGVTPGVCTMARDCGHAAVMEFNGDVYSCDHFVFPEHKLGNIRSHTLVEMLYGEQQTAFGRMKQDTLARQCRECQWLFACNGECPKNRWEGGLNYLCQGYRQFFGHVAPAMDRMKELLQQGLPPADIMKEYGR